MKWVTIKLGEILVAKFGIEQDVLITGLHINGMTVISRMPLVVVPAGQLTISVEEEKHD